ncbi:MAG: hypothetical protein JXA97_01150, partial [Anaerolineales bacterium]|nr:hypothetical protein [Anaerolineales bacterium]
MKRMGLKKAILAVLAAAITTVSLLAWAPPAEAQVAPLNAVVGIFRVFNALNRRNRVYRAAHDAQQDFNAYYSSLQDTARGQLLSGELSSLRQGEDGPERSRAAAYIRMSA